LPRCVVAAIVARCDKAAKRDPADHCRKNEPEGRINSQCRSPSLNGRPWLVKFSTRQKAPGNRDDAMSQGRGASPLAIAHRFVFGALLATEHKDGKRRTLRCQSRTKHAEGRAEYWLTAFAAHIRRTRLRRVGSAICACRR